MKIFLIEIFKFFIVLTITLVGLDLGISYFLKQSHDNPAEYEVMNDIYQGNATCDIAIYGSSRAWVHIDPEILQESLHASTYNFGIDGHNFGLQYMRHLELLKFNKKPKVILLSLDVFSMEKGKNLYNAEQFLPYMLWNKNIRNFTSSYNGYSRIDYFFPMIRYIGKKSILSSAAANIYKENAIKYRKRGYKGMPRIWNRDLSKAKRGGRRYERQIDPTLVKLLEKFVLECADLGIKLILVYTPEYIEGQEFVANRTKIIDVYSSLAKKHQLLFLDYSKSEICMNKDYFYNASHLNNKGSELFTKILADDLKNKRSTPSLNIN